MAAVGKKLAAKKIGGGGIAPKAMRQRGPRKVGDPCDLGPYIGKVPYTGDVEVDSLAEVTAVEKAFARGMSDEVDGSANR